MRQSIEENIKFIMFLIVYSVGVAYWAASMKTTVEQHTIIMTKTVELLDAHIEECRKKEVEKVRRDYILRDIQNDILNIQDDMEDLKEELNGTQKG